MKKNRFQNRKKKSQEVIGFLVYFQYVGDESYVT